MIALVVALGSARRVDAVGYWNLPGTWSQYFGHGFSGGYHACYMLGPIPLDAWRSRNEVRLPCAPNPYACAPYANGSANRNYGCELDHPSMMPENVVPATAPDPAPAPAAAPDPAPAAAAPAKPSALLFGPPVQR